MKGYQIQNVTGYKHGQWIQQTSNYNCIDQDCILSKLFDIRILVYVMFAQIYVVLHQEIYLWRRRIFFFNLKKLYPDDCLMHIFI